VLQRRVECQLHYIVGPTEGRGERARRGKIGAVGVAKRAERDSRDPDVYGRGRNPARVESSRECYTNPLRPVTRSTNSVTEKRPKAVDAGVGRELRRGDSGRGEAERGDHGLDVPKDAPPPD
jgi:hypothetical protein